MCVHLSRYAALYMFLSNITTYKCIYIYIYIYIHIYIYIVNVVCARTIYANLCQLYIHMDPGRSEVACWALLQATPSCKASSNTLRTHTYTHELYRVIVYMHRLVYIYI